MVSWSWLLVAAAALLGGIAQTVTGFGSGIVMASILPYAFGMLQAPALSSAISLLLSATLAFRYRENIDWRAVLVPAALYIAASVTIIHLVRRMNLRVLGAVFGLFLILLCVYYLFGENRFPMPGGRTMLVVCSVVSGLTGGLFGIGGPLMALYFLERTDSREAYMADLQMLFLVTGASGLIARIANGIYTVDLILPTVLGVAAISLGRVAGNVVAERLDAGTLKRAIYIFVGLSGLVTLVKQLG